MCDRDGTILGAFASDHLDCVGHYPHSQADGTEVTGWVRSGAGFNSERFGLMWSRISDFIAAGKHPPTSKASTGKPARVNP